MFGGMGERVKTDGYQRGAGLCGRDGESLKTGSLLTIPPPADFETKGRL